MKQNLALLLTSITLLGLAQIASAETIVCTSKDKDRAVFTRVTDKELEDAKVTGPAYRAEIDEALSSNLLGAVDKDQNRWIIFSKGKDNGTTSMVADVSDWDGNTGIDIKFPRSVVFNPTKGKKFQAKLTVTYSDIADDEVENEVSCLVK